MHLDRYWFISSTILTSSWELCYWEEMIWTIFNGLEKVAGKTFSRHASWDCKGISIFSQTVNLPVFRLWWTTDITKFKTFFSLFWSELISAWRCSILCHSVLINQLGKAKSSLQYIGGSCSCLHLFWASGHSPPDRGPVFPGMESCPPPPSPVNS